MLDFVSHWGYFDTFFFNETTEEKMCNNTACGSENAAGLFYTTTCGSSY